MNWYSQIVWSHIICRCFIFLFFVNQRQSIKSFLKYAFSPLFQLIMKHNFFLTVKRNRYAATIYEKEKCSTWNQFRYVWCTFQSQTIWMLSCLLVNWLDWEGGGIVCVYYIYFRHFIQAVIGLKVVVRVFVFLFNEIFISSCY